jgi:hypothetical protein
MAFRKTLLLLLPLALSACDSSQPTYSASNANSAPQATPAPALPPAPKPVVAAPPATAPAAVPQVVPAPPKPPYDPYRNRYVSVPPGKMGPVEALGVGNCDDYIERYRTCFNNTEIPKDPKFELRVALGSQVRDWKQDIVAGRISKVAAACSDASQKARAEFAKWGCTSF